MRPEGYQVTWVDNLHTAQPLIDETGADLVVVEEQLIDGSFRQLLEVLERQHPTVPAVLFTNKAPDALPKTFVRPGLIGVLTSPLRPEEVLDIVEVGLAHRQRWQAWARTESLRTTRSLRRQVDDLEALAQVGQSVTAMLDLDRVLTAVVEAAVELTGAEEGSLLLIDEASGDLYMRAARNFQDEFVQTFRLPVQDTLAGQVIQSGKPILVDEKTPQKIKTSYLVHTLIYVPLKVHGRVIGVLGVDNRQSGHVFKEHHIPLLSAMADYAAIAIDNARLYSRTEIERRKLETILTEIEDGVIVLDPHEQVILINHTARLIFGLDEEDDLNGGPLRELIQNRDLINALDQSGETPYRIEIELEEGRTFNVQFTPIPDVGQAVTMQDVTHFKELDRIKSDFVSTVSHDLRSPLTAILGYVELIDRSGPTTAQQREFIQRVQISVKNITELINNLLDLGRIEAGLDAQREPVPVPAIVNYAIDGLQHQLSEKNHRLTVDMPEDLPPVRGNPIRIRQLFDNLIENAIKYTPPEGEIRIQLQREEDQVIAQVTDTGIGIPRADQPYIFDKLYRATNLDSDTPGTGLGLSIVKSIVESHHGRIWVESNPGKGSTFIVVLPITPEA